MPRDASELARRLACRAEAVCRHYLSNGRRQGRYWTVGDVRNTPGRSMFVRLSGPESGPGAAGHWTDAASAEYGDLLDVIRESCGLVDFKDVVDEARRFLSLPRAEPRRTPKLVRTPVPAGSPEAARRLFAMSQPIRRTLVETYLRNRGIKAIHDAGALRFHPRCYYRPDEHSPTETWPAMVAAVTDLDGRITGSHRTWLARDGSGKAPVDTPRRAMGGLLGHGVRFGAVDDVLAVGEGIETMLSLRCALPAMPMAAALSANHLAALLLPPALRRLYIARDADAAGDTAFAALTERAEAAGIEALALSPRTGDFNDDLRAFGLRALRAALRIQLAPQDCVCFIRLRTARTE
ncbi:DNA primase [Aurantimonas aggregata]|uniref:DNA primase n=1 Tax=Aurantimonas aggregata TaxID=2047720 RepID=A0A6L9MI71_9HYPH|nr:toprim domain-containing protein [Aurantimonas aggregata]NDV87408.1 DNA primase [Aurantimonas aggregata]